ncbi:hypothetical protein R83H12_00543 [Fibrobacteria bacterium R8-3-H12]
MNENEYKELNAVHLDTVKELSRIVKEQAKQLEHINVSKYDTCCKYITISVIAIALFATIVLCCIFGSQNKQFDRCSELKLKQTI